MAGTWSGAGSFAADMAHANGSGSWESTGSKKSAQTGILGVCLQTRSITQLPLAVWRVGEAKENFVAFIEKEGLWSQEKPIRFAWMYPVIALNVQIETFQILMWCLYMRSYRILILIFLGCKHSHWGFFFFFVNSPYLLSSLGFKECIYTYL